ncbi:zinc transporter ZIP13 homolog isoform X2 [Cephus cinctus]|nr:zinc transporter ZIP13 homolog isoform X2 [Cephus cinctus]
MLYEIVSEEIWTPWNAAIEYFEYQPWFFSLLGSIMVGLSGVLPLLVIPIEEGANLKNGASAGTLKMLLSFAVGGLLGDVFLHLLPEAWANKNLNKAYDGHRSVVCGLWVLAGFLVFIVAEKMFAGEEEEDDEEEEEEEQKKEEFSNNNSHTELENNNCLKLDGAKKDFMKNGMKSNGFARNIVHPLSDVKNLKNGYIKDASVFNATKRNGFVKGNANGYLIAQEIDGYLKNTGQSNGIIKNVNANGLCAYQSTLSSTVGSDNITEIRKQKPKRIIGYLNLMANCIDNFTHGLAVGGSFLVSFRLGALTTLAILVHEIPHEVGDFAILLKSGFNRWDAAKAQIMTAGGGIFGALVAVLCSGGGVEARTSWILPFTAGGFLHIGLVTVLPELLKETNPKESLKQFGSLLLGITLMAMLTILCD